MSALAVSARDELREFDLDLEVEVPAGKTLAVVGPSGAGKTTLLKTIAGLHSPAAGSVRLGGEAWLDTAAGVDLDPEQRSCGFLFQDYALFPHLTAWQNVAFATPGPRAERRRRAVAELERFGIGALAGSRPAELSGGERQRVALARALVRGPQVLLLDEPLSALDARTRAHAERELAEAITGTGVPAVIVTHDFTEAAVLGDEICVIDRGVVAQRGTAAEVAARPASALVADLAGSVVLTGEATGAADGTEGTTQIALDGGGVAYSTDPASGPVAISIFPWEITLEPAGTGARGSALNRIDADVVSVAEVGNRARIGLAAPQRLIAEVTAESARSLGLVPGARVQATWKATATRIVAC